MYSRSFIANFGKKIFAKLAYLLKTVIKALSTLKWVIEAFFKKCISLLALKIILKAAMYIIKIS